MNKTSKNGIPGTESFVLFQNCQGENGRGTLIHFTRNLVVFETYNPFSIIQLSEVLQELRIYRGERAIYSGKAVVNALVPTGHLLIVSATLTDPWSDLAGLEPGKGLRNETKRFVKEWEQNNRIKPSYQLMSSNIRNFLEELSRWLDQAEVALDIKDESEKSMMLKREFVEEVDNQVGPKLDQFFMTFEEETKKLLKEELPLHAAFAQRFFHPLTLFAPFIHRAFTKPLGYAGDYLMMKMLIDDPWDGLNTYAKIINNFVMRKDPAKAYRNRISMLLDILQSETRRVSSNGHSINILNHTFRQFF